MAEAFNVDRFMEGSGKIDLSDIDWSEVPRYRLTPEALRTVRYVMRTESSTFFYAKAFMNTTAAVREPDLAPFLSAWMYEEEFHGRAFRRFLEAYGEHIPNDARPDQFRTRSTGERIDELGQAALSYAFPDDWPAAHMVWGSIQEFTTYSAYQALIERTDHPILHVICQRIMKQELRHFAFYREHAKKRLTRSVTARRLASFALRMAWTPVGDGMSPKDEVIHAIRFLFDGVDGTAIDRIDRKTRELPGLEWFDLFSRFAERHAIRQAPATWTSRLRGEAHAPGEAVPTPAS